MKALQTISSLGACLRSPLLPILGVCLLAACRGTITADPTVEAVKSFYNWRISEDINGVPTQDQLVAMEPYLSKELSSLLRQTSIDYAPSEKPSEARTIENGDWFTSMFDGPTSFRVGEVQSEGGRYLVAVRFTSAQQLPAVNWHDRIVVVEEDGKHVIANVMYENHWAFKQDATLIDALKDPKARRKRRS
jgi:hypothetical protein